MLTLRPLVRLSAALLFALIAPALRAQTLHNPNGTPYTPLFTDAVGHYIGALDVDDQGNLYYLDTDTAASDTDGDLHLRLIERSTTGTLSTLFDFGAHGFTGQTFGSFVRLHGTDIYWGESTTGTLWSGTLASDGASLSASGQLGQIAGNYDLTFTSGGAAYLSADPTFNSENHVYRLTLGHGAISTQSNAISKLYLSGDYSGPVASDLAGNLLYGNSGVLTAGGLFRYSAADLAGNQEITIDQSHPLLANGGNQALAFKTDGSELFQDVTIYDANFSPTGLVRRYLYDGSFAAQTLGVSSGGSVGPLASSGGQVFTVVSVGSGTSSHSAIFSVAPEPGSSALLAIGAAACASRRRRRDEVA